MVFENRDIKQLPLPDGTEFSERGLDPSVAMPNRRRTPRKSLRELVYIGMGSENGGVVLDVSEGGLAFQAVAPIRDARTIHFSLMVAGRGRFEGTGAVAWSSETGRTCGLRFVHLPEEGREQIQIWSGRPQPITSVVGDSLQTPGHESVLPDKPDAAPAETNESISADNSAATQQDEPASDRLTATDVLLERTFEPVESVSELEIPRRAVRSLRVNSLSMFPPDAGPMAEAEPAAPPHSVVSKHSVAAIAFTVVLAFLIAMGILSSIYWREATGFLNHLAEKIRGWM